jgi:quercetin dioxygenase-like cupin family protein
MEREEFLGILAREGFAEAVTVKRDANAMLDVHEHPFEAKALILAGELTLRVGETDLIYQPGDVFHLRAHEAHAERYGADGVTYLVGRK